jgi:hypothetical protein
MEAERKSSRLANSLLLRAFGNVRHDVDKSSTANLEAKSRRPQKQRSALPTRVGQGAHSSGGSEAAVTVKLSDQAGD